MILCSRYLGKITFILLVQNFLALETSVVTDEGLGCIRHSENVFAHKTVFHRRSYVDPETGYHYKAIERMRLDANS